jgi:uncharacterized protein (DUF983 family)
VLAILLIRALLRRCPGCGSGGLFRRWCRMVEACPGCGRRFVREDGYWLGAMIVNLAVTEAAFLAVLVGGMLLTWPDVPWTALLVASVGVNALVPLVFYPFSRTVWVALDLGFLQRMEPADSEDELARRNAV